MKKRNYIRLLYFSGLLMNFIALPGQDTYKIKPMGFTSRATDEIVTAFSPSGIMISSNRSSSSYLFYTDRDKKNFFDIYEVRRNESGNWESPELLSPALKTMQNDGPATLNTEGDLIIFTRNLTTRRFGNAIRVNPYVGLFFATMTNGRWGRVQPFEHNTRDADNMHPALSKDGNILYFSSNRPGGFGGFDLYRSRLVDGKWTMPENLGPNINTPENDVFPFVHASGRLYFSSDGHDRPGRHDLYYTEMYNDEWISPVKLPPPLNSFRSNDFTIILDENFENGFLTSARRGSFDVFTVESIVPSFEVCQQQKIDNFCFVFYENSTVEIDTSLYKYRWDLGDGTSVEAVEAEHCFNGPGTYEIKLDVIDVLTKEVMFNQAEYELELIKTTQAFITCPDTVNINSEVQFNGSESYFGNLVPLEYYWDFGSGEKAVGISVKHKFLIPGKYNIKLGVKMREIRGDEESLRKFCSYKSITVTE